MHFPSFHFFVIQTVLFYNRVSFALLHLSNNSSDVSFILLFFGSLTHLLTHMFSTYKYNFYVHSYAFDHRQNAFFLHSHFYVFIVCA